jgi:tetratricopeptide (TPR) repeat protein
MKIMLLQLLLMCFLSIHGQVIIEKPAVAEQTHSDLTILRIVRYQDSTVVCLSVENKLAQGGWFCADKKIYIEDAKSLKQYKILKTNGIPTCPDSYNFTYVGEKLNFTLIFPYIPQNVNLINLVEDCNNACFRFNEIILDEKRNNDIKMYDKGYQLYTNKQPDEAILFFSKVVELIPNAPVHVYGFSYYYLVKIYLEKGNNEKAKFWFEQLKKSNLPDKQYFIDSLKKEGYEEK